MKKLSEINIFIDKDISISFKETNDIIIVTINGILDTYNSSAFSKNILELKDTMYKKIILNISGLTYVSSTGIGSFIQIKKEFSNLQLPISIVICGIIKKVKDIFDLLGFSSFFTIFENLEDAILFYKNSEKSIPATIPVFVPKIDLPIKTIICSFCKKRLISKKSGKFRCPNCKSIIIVD